MAYLDRRAFCALTTAFVAVALQSACAAPAPTTDSVVPEHQELTQLTARHTSAEIIAEEKKSIACVKGKMGHIIRLYSVCAKTSSESTPRHSCHHKEYDDNTQYIIDEAHKVVALACELHPEDAKKLQYKEDTFRSKMLNLQHYFRKCSHLFTQCKINKFEKYLSEAVAMVTPHEATEGSPGVCTEA
jgi:hypothetical protein